MPNEKKHALRYLLLRFLWTYRKAVPENLYQEVAKTLTVSETDKGFTVKWMHNGQDFQKDYRKNEFEFFVRGDNIKQETTRNTDSERNSRVAQEFVIQSLNLKELKDETNKESLFPKMLLNLCGYAICAVLIWLVGGQDFTMAVVGILIFFLFSVEFWYEKGKLLIPPLLAIFIVIGFPFTAIVTAAFYFLFQSLEPDKKWRGIRLLASLAVFSYGLFEVIWNGIVPFYNIWVVLIAVIVLATFLIRWTAGSHFRLMPLTFPFVSIGVYLDGCVQPAMILLVFAILSALLAHKGYCFVPVQKER